VNQQKLFYHALSCIASFLLKNMGHFLHQGGFCSDMLDLKLESCGN
jgi:hypothetical protein